MAVDGDSGPGEALRESERRLRLAVGAAHIGIWDWNVLTNEMVWSEEAKAIAGLPAGKPVTFDQVSDVTHPEDLPRTQALSRRALDPAERLHEPYEYRIVRPDGSLRWVVAQGEAVFATVDGHERAVRYVGTVRDITERKHAETVLQESESRLRIAIDAARVGIWDYDVPTSAFRASPELNRILGFPPEDALDVKAVQARYYPGDDEKVRLAGEDAVKRGDRHFQAEFRFYWADGALRSMLMRAEIIFGPDQAPGRVIGAVIDITERKEAEERQVFLMRELIHRVRNTLASVRAIAAATLRGSRNLKEAETALSARIGALADLNTLLSSTESRRADLRELVAAVIEPHRTATDRISVSGPSLVLAERESLAVSLALHELATNATKYGALSLPEGRVDLAWTVSAANGDPPMLRLVWREHDGPPVRQPRRRGFGSRLIEQAAAGDPRGRVEVVFASTGLVCTIEMPATPWSRDTGEAS